MKSLLTVLLTPVLMLVAANAGAACWSPVPAASKITFKIDQAGAPMQGTFHNYSGLICIGSADAASDHIKVQVDLKSIDTQLPELDDALRGADFFNVARWPDATFESESIHVTGKNEYEVDGKLTIRDVVHNIKVPVTFKSDAGNAASLAGHLTLQRLDYNIGLGQWADTRWVGNQVDIDFSVALKPAQSN